MPIAEGIIATKGAIEVSKIALDLLRRPSIDAHEVRDKLIELQDLILSAQRALSEAEEDNRALRRELDDRKALETLTADMEFVDDGGYWVRKSEVAQGRTIPYCNVCWASSKAVPLGKVGGHNDAYCCQIDRSSYYTKAYRDRHKRTTSMRSDF
jgi:hypothetical protein